MQNIISTYKLTPGLLPIGSTYGELTIVEKTKRKTIPPDWRPFQFYNCSCSCDSEERIEVSGNDLLSGAKTHCGCLDPKPEPESDELPTNKTRLYKIYMGIKARCYNKSHGSYSSYGGRGIVMCPEWEISFEQFKEWSLANGYDDTLTIDRKDNNIGYTVENCRWANRKQQQRNLRSNHLEEYMGETKTVIEWAEDPRCLVTPKTLYSRLSYGWSMERALTVPANNPKANKYQ